MALSAFRGWAAAVGRRRLPWAGAAVGGVGGLPGVTLVVCALGVAVVRLLVRVGV